MAPLRGVGGPPRGWTRREWIVAAGAGALAACTPARASRRGPITLPREGEIVGASDKLGHRLRDQPPPSLPAGAAREKTGVLIVGGGVAGLAAAWRLLRAGVEDFTLLELEPVVGGTARGGALGGLACPWGAHYISAPRAEQRALCTLLAELGLFEGVDADGDPVVAEQYLVADPDERLYYKGRWSEGLWLGAGERKDDRRQLAAFQAEIDRWVAWRDARGRRAFTLPIAACSDDPEATALDGQSMAAWMDARGFTSSRLRWLVEYACHDDYGAAARHVSAWAGLFYWAARVRRVGEESAPFVTWPDGNGHLVAHLARGATAQGGRVRTGWAVADLSPRADGGVDAVAIDPSGASRGFTAERVIFCAPHFLATRVIADWRAAPPPHVASFQYGAWMVANLLLADRPASRGAPLAWDNVLYESDALGYVVATHQTGRDRGPTVFTYYRPMLDDDPAAGRRALYQGDWRHWAGVALADLSRAHPELPRLTRRLDVMRWGHAMIRPAPGFLFGDARRAAATPFRGVHFANTDLSGVPLFEEAFDHGVRAAEEVLAARGVDSPCLRGT
jgi:phytoene dehydrogenase-like protein